MRGGGKTRDANTQLLLSRRQQQQQRNHGTAHALFMAYGLCRQL